MIHLDERTWKLLKEGVKKYINEYYSEYIKAGKGIKPILIGLYGRNVDREDLPSKKIRDWVETSWIRSSRRDKTVEFLILWRYLRILRETVIVDCWPNSVVIDPSISNKELKTIVI